jgi:hypothetical protein
MNKSGTNPKIKSADAVCGDVPHAGMMMRKLRGLWRLRL